MARGALPSLLFVLVLLAGCDTIGTVDFDAVSRLVGTGSGTVGEHVVTGALVTVASSAQTALEQLGLNPVRNREGDAIRLDCYTAHGQHFALVLTGLRTEAGEHTRLCFEWEDSPDETLEMRVLNLIELRAKI